MPSLAHYTADISDELNSTFEAFPAFRSDLLLVCSLSEFFLEFIKTSLQATQLLESGDLDRSYEGAQFSQYLHDIGADLDETLRQVRHREMARIIFRDLTRRADLIETTRDLSALADACIEAALQYHYLSNVARYGRPMGVSGEQQQMCVLALGKLGALELNVSSDIDLIFFYGEAGEVSGAATRKNGLSNQEFFIRTSRQIIKSIDTVLPAGFVFRVDMRLRPYGESGALILNRAAMEKYFLEQGRDWERYAFIKARAAAGDKVLGEDFLDWLRPFVFRRHLDYGAVEALRDMKRLINNEVTKKGLHDDVKLGPGGIREIEFVVQAQQLVWGGNKPALQTRRLLDALSVLDSGGYLPAQDATALRQAYIFLRNSEHVIQAEKDRQTQQLPLQQLSRERLARAMEFENYDAYLQQLDFHRAKVSACFTRIMSSNNAEQDILIEGNLFWVSVWRDLSSPGSIDLLGQNGYRQMDTMLPKLKQFQQGLQDIQQIAVDRIERLMPVILRACALEARPDETLVRLLPILSGVLRRSTYLSFLLENKDAMTRLVQLCAMSPWVANRVAEYPILMYELTDKNTQNVDLNPEGLMLELKEQLRQYDADDLEAKMDSLRRFKNAAVLRVAVFELLNLIPLMQASGNLTCIAELVLDAATDLAFDYLIGRHGEPCDRAGNKQGRCFAVIAYGKLGGLELAYGSDLDVVFLHDADIQGETDGLKPVANNVFFSRLGQRIVHILSSLTRFGVLYEVDLRLRPDGNKGPLVGTFRAYERYLQQEAWTWEVQALVRARFVAGDLRYELQFQEIRSRILASDRNKLKLKLDVMEMREKMRQHLDKTGVPAQEAENILVSGFDLKQGAGAIIDIEFLIQYLVLANCDQTPELAAWTDKIRLMETLVSEGLLSPEEADVLRQAYIAYRSAVHYMWLGGRMVSYDQLNDHREKVVNIWLKYFENGR